MTSEINEITENDQEVVVSQKDYRPTPYQNSEWEGLAEFDRNAKFKAIPLEVLEADLEFDPMFEQFDGEERKKRKEAQSVIQQVEEEEEVVQPSEELIAEIRSAAYEEGRQEGIKEGVLEAQSGIIERYEELSATLAGITTNIRAELDQRVSDLEKRALDLALDISKRILDTTVEVKPEYILSVIKRALEELGAQKNITVRISHQDYEFLEVVGLPEDLISEQSKIRFVPDEKISGGCMVETEYGSINLELDHMWNEVKDKIYSNIE